MMFIRLYQGSNRVMTVAAQNLGNMVEVEQDQMPEFPDGDEGTGHELRHDDASNTIYWAEV